MPKFIDFFVYRPSDEYQLDGISNIVNDKGYVEGAIKISDATAEIIN